MWASSAPRHQPRYTSNCAPRHGLISWGVSLMRQLPAPSAAAWLFDLGDLRGPWIVVLRDHERKRASDSPSTSSNSARAPTSPPPSLLSRTSPSITPG